MTNTIFDLIEEEVPEGEEGFFFIAEKAPPSKDETFFDSVSDYGKTLLKGTIEGVSALGRSLGPLDTGKSTEQVLKEQTQTLEEVFPTQEGFTQTALRRGLKQAPTMISFPGGGIQALPRSIAAGFLGESAKELGAPELVQSIAELTAFIGPDVTKKLLETGKSGEIVKKAREMGLTDKQIAPLLQGEVKQKWLSKLVPRRGKTQEILAETKKGIGKGYDSILEGKPYEGRLLSEKGGEALNKNLDVILEDLPSSVRGKISQDIADFRNKAPSVKTAINLYQDINHELGPKSKQLSRLKKPILKELTNISPQLGEEFETLNKLYEKYSQIQQRLQPNLMTDLIGAAKSLQVLGGLAFGYYPVLVEVAGQQVAQKLSQQLLLNPRFQQIGMKIANAVEGNKFGLINKLIKEMQNLLKKKFPEVEKMLEDIPEDEIKELFLSNQRKIGEQ